MCLFLVQNNAAIGAGQVWRLATCAFLHSGLLHLVMNLFSLNSLGPMMERTSNHRRFGAVYFAGALGCSLLSFYKSPVNSLGASGVLPHPPLFPKQGDALGHLQGPT